MTCYEQDFVNPSKSGFNGGLALFDLNAVRLSEEYDYAIFNLDKYLKNASKASPCLGCCKAFGMWMGDQDFYTVFDVVGNGFIKRLPCHWNVQTCEHWYGVKNTHKTKSQGCDKVNVLHANEGNKTIIKELQQMADPVKIDLVLKSKLSRISQLI